jgi:hypothetical protein
MRLLINPINIVFNSGDKALVYSIVLCYDFLTTRVSTYFSCYVSGYLVTRVIKVMILARWKISALVARMPAFSRRIRHVRELITQKQMIWSHASWIVAMVQHTVRCGILSRVKRPRDSMSKLGSSLATSYSDVPISCWIFAGEPNPASFSLVHFAPKAFRRCLYGVNVHVHNLEEIGKRVY